MQIQQIVLGLFFTNCYIVSGAVPGSCILIDPADSGEQIRRQLERLGMRPEAVILTHGHYDHFLAVPDLQKHWPGLPVCCHPLDCPEETVEYDMGQAFPTVTAFSDRKPLADQQRLSLAGLDITVLHTPGHTKGSVTLVIEDVLFTGDTLFAGSIGRTDLEGGDDAQMAESLGRLVSLAADYRVYPGHGSITTLDEERRNNPYLKAAEKKGTAFRNDLHV